MPREENFPGQKQARDGAAKNWPERSEEALTPSKNDTDSARASPCRPPRQVVMGILLGHPPMVARLGLVPLGSVWPPGLAVTMRENSTCLKGQAWQSTYLTPAALGLAFTTPAQTWSHKNNTG